MSGRRRSASDESVVPVIPARIRRTVATKSVGAPRRRYAALRDTAHTCSRVVLPGASSMAADIATHATKVIASPSVEFQSEDDECLG
jgi:hypothetical protein